MAGLFDKQAELYANARPNYPAELYRKLAALTPNQSLAWDVGTGNGQAAVAIAEHYDKVIATDVSSVQLKCATPHPKVQYIHTPLSFSDNNLVPLLGVPENSLDLVTVAQAVHWFDLPSFYGLATRLLRKPGGVVALWGYNDAEVGPTFDPVMRRVHEATIPFIDPRSTKYLLHGYKTLPFPFEGVGMGREGEPLGFEVVKEVSFEVFLGAFRSRSAVCMAKERGVDLLSEEVVGELERAWGGAGLVRSVTYKAFMLVGKVKM